MKRDSAVCCEATVVLKSASADPTRTMFFEHFCPSDNSFRSKEAVKKTEQGQTGALTAGNENLEKLSMYPWPKILGS